MEYEASYPCSWGGEQPRIMVRSVRSQSDGTEVMIGLTVECGEHREQKSFLLSMEQYAQLLPEKGEITEEQYDRLEEASALCSAVRCGEHLLSYGANSVQMLTRKLVQHGFRREVAQSAAQLLTEKGLIDEATDIRREIEKCLRKLWGSKRITAHLWNRGYGAEQLADLSAFYEEIDFSEQCRRLIVKHFGALPEDADAQRKMIAYLSRYGYALGEIRQAIKSLMEE
jgi:SOS response regulatory protein OraA/RecX